MYEMRNAGCISALLNCFHYMDDKSITPHPVHVVSAYMFDRLYVNQSLVVENLSWSCDNGVKKSSFGNISHVGCNIDYVWRNHTKKKTYCIEQFETE